MTRRPTPSRSELTKAASRTKPSPAREAVPQHPDLEHVPTVAELFARGLAIPHGTAFRLTPEGQAEIYAAMTRNAERCTTDPDLRRRVERHAVIAHREG